MRVWAPVALALASCATAASPRKASGAAGKCKAPKCPFVYVYESAPISKLLLKQLDAGFDEKINTDMILHKAILDSGCTVSDPSQASFFFVPYYSSTKYPKEMPKTRPFCELINHLQTDYRDSIYWKRNGQRDHALAVTRIADSYVLEKMISATNSRISLHVIESLHARNATFPLPYPIHQISSGKSIMADPAEREPGAPAMGLAFFAGSSTLNSMSGNSSTAMRLSLRQAMQDRPSDCLFMETRRVGGNTHNVVNQVWKDRRKANHMVDTSADFWFCPVPPGDSASSARFFDSFWRLCIPVLIGTKWELPFRHIIPYEKIIIAMPKASLASPAAAAKALSQLAQISIEERVKRRKLMLQYKYLFDLRYLPQRPTGVRAILRFYANRARELCRRGVRKLPAVDRGWEDFRKSECEQSESPTSRRPAQQSTSVGGVVRVTKSERGAADEG